MDAQSFTHLSATHSLHTHRDADRLPVARYRRHLLYLVESHATVIVLGETGSGKTTQIPQYLDEAGERCCSHAASFAVFCCPIPFDEGGSQLLLCCVCYLLSSSFDTETLASSSDNTRAFIPSRTLHTGWTAGGRMVACTQPRRAAAVTVASRVAEEAGSALGDAVGYAVRFENVMQQVCPVFGLARGWNCFHCLLMGCWLFAVLKHSYAQMPCLSVVIKCSRQPSI